ncbi:hypothetical protein P9112_007240 [Eukaryota sp. TZLM1-RC]
MKTPNVARKRRGGGKSPFKKHKQSHKQHMTPFRSPKPRPWSKTSPLPPPHPSPSPIPSQPPETPSLTIGDILSDVILQELIKRLPKGLADDFNQRLFRIRIMNFILNLQNLQFITEIDTLSPMEIEQLENDTKKEVIFYFEIFYFVNEHFPYTDLVPISQITTKFWEKYRLYADFNDRINPDSGILKSTLADFIKNDASVSLEVTILTQEVKQNEAVLEFFQEFVRKKIEVSFNFLATQFTEVKFRKFSDMQNWWDENFKYLVSTLTSHFWTLFHGLIKINNQEMVFLNDLIEEKISSSCSDYIVEFRRDNLVEKLEESDAWKEFLEAKAAELSFEKDLFIKKENANILSPPEAQKEVKFFIEEFLRRFQHFSNQLTDGTLKQVGFVIKDVYSELKFNDFETLNCLLKEVSENVFGDFASDDYPRRIVVNRLSSIVERVCSNFGVSLYPNFEGFKDYFADANRFSLPDAHALENLQLQHL